MILRYLLDDNKEMAAVAEKHILSGAAFVTIEVMAEVVYVLKGVYKLDRAKIAGVLEGLLDLDICCDKEVLTPVSSIFGKHNLDFVDCVLYAYHMVYGVQVATFDQKLLRLIHSTQN